MLRILEELLKKRNVKVEELEPEEREQFERWDKVLSEGELTLDKVKQFCQGQVRIIKTKLKDVDNSDKKNERLVLLFNVYDALLDAINAPQAEREQLEKYLYALIDKS